MRARTVALAVVPFAGWAALAFTPTEPAIAGFPVRLFAVPLAAWVFWIVANGHGDTGRLGGVGEVGVAAVAAAWMPPIFGWSPPPWTVPVLAIGSALAWWVIVFKDDPPPRPRMPAGIRRTGREPKIREPRQPRHGPLERLHVAETEDGKPWLMDLSPGNHTLVAGATKAGKGGVVWAVIRELKPAIDAGLVRLVLIDPKGGMELYAAAGLADAVAWGDEDDADERITELLETEAGKVRDSAVACRVKGIRSHVPTPGDPVTIIVIDEILAITDEIVDPKLRARIDAALKRILRQGRAPGWVVVACTQDPSKEALGSTIVRGFPVKVCLRVTDAGQVDMVMGPGIRVSHGADAHLIPKSQPGAAFVWNDESQSVARVRFRHVTDRDIRALSAGAAPREVGVSVPVHVDYGPAVDVGHDDVAAVAEPVESLAGRLLEAWPVKPNGEPYASLHAADLGPLVGLSEDGMVAELDAEGVCEKVTARPLTPDPGTGKRGPATGKKGLRYAALQEWARATSRATA